MHYFDTSHQHSLFAAEADPSDLITNYPQVEATLPELLKLIENINALDDKRSKLVEDFRNYGHYERCKLVFNFFFDFFYMHTCVRNLAFSSITSTHTHTHTRITQTREARLFVCWLLFFFVLHAGFLSCVILLWMCTHTLILLYSLGSNAHDAGMVEKALFENPEVEPEMIEAGIWPVSSPSMRMYECGRERVQSVCMRVRNVYGCEVHI